MAIYLVSKIEFDNVYQYLLYQVVITPFKKTISRNRLLIINIFSIAVVEVDYNFVLLILFLIVY